VVTRWRPSTSFAVASSAGKNPICGQSIHGMFLFLALDFTTADGVRCSACLERSVEPPPPAWAPSIPVNH
jgi:hypothetical protein